LPNDLDNL